MTTPPLPKSAVRFWERGLGGEVERLAQIEESALSPEKQDVLRHALLQMARLAGENG